MSTAANSPTVTTSWEQIRQESLAAMTEAERAEYNRAAIEAEARLQTTELADTPLRSTTQTEDRSAADHDEGLRMSKTDTKEPAARSGS